MRLAGILLALATSALGADYYVAPNGSPAVAGTISDPWSLGKVCTGSANPSPIQPGDTIWLRGGEYVINAPISCQFVGTESQRIALRAFPAEIPMLVCAFSINGNCATFDNSQYFDLWGVWMIYRGSRIELLGGSNPVGDAVPGAFSAYSGVYNRFINLAFIGPADPIGFAHRNDDGSIFYGTLTVAVGGEAPDRSHGGAGYIQNEYTRPAETIENIIAISGYRGSCNLGMYASQAPYTQKVTFRNVISNVSWCIGAYDGFTTSVKEVRIENSLARGISMPYSGNYIKDAVVTGNLFASAVTHYRVSGGTFSNNWAVGGYTVNQCSTLPEGGSCTAPTVSGNQTGTPASNWVVVYPNTFEEGRAHIGIFNWTNTPAQQVDMSSVWTVGQFYEVIDAWNPLAPPVWRGRYEGGSISLPLDGRAGTYLPEGRTDACWHVGRETCCTSGDYVCAASAAELPTNVPQWQPAITTNDWRIYYWSGSAWTDTGYTMPTQRDKPDLGRGDGKLHAFIARRAFRAAQRTTVHWVGTIADTVEYQAEGRWFPGLNKQCPGSVCSAEILGYGGYGTWRVNGGSPMVAFLR